MHTDTWNNFIDRARRLAAGASPADAIDHAIHWQLEGTEPFCRAAHAVDDLQLPEMHSGAPWSEAAHRPGQVGDRWVAFLALNPSLDEDESFPRVVDLERRGADSLVSFFDERFAPQNRGGSLRRGRSRGKVRTWSPGGRPHAVRTWSVLDGLMREALAGLDAPAPLGDFAAIVDVVPYKFRQWSAVRRDLRDELLDLSRRPLTQFMAQRTPSMVVLLGVDTHRSLDWFEPVRAVAEAPIDHGVRTHGIYQVPAGQREFEILASYHPTSHAWNQSGTRNYLAASIRAHLLDEGRIR